MLSIDPFALGISLTMALLMDFYFALLIHLRYCGQFGLWFFFPSMVVFSMPSVFVVGIPSYFIFVSSASPIKKGLLFFVLLALCFVVCFRVGKVFLKKRFPPTQKSLPTESKENPAIPSTIDK